MHLRGVDRPAHSWTADNPAGPVMLSRRLTADGSRTFSQSVVQFSGHSIFAPTHSLPSNFGSNSIGSPSPCDLTVLPRRQFDNLRCFKTGF